jgi:hypothetical protein
METVGGYRLVRRLGSGTRADIHLGHAGSHEPPEGDRVAAIKVFRLHTDDGSIDREIEALARASSRHLLELRDLATGADGRPCLILPRLGSGTLARLLALRDRIEPGEAVTLLVPLVDAVRELHRVGVAHGAVRTGSVLFDDHGAPVLARFGSAGLIGEFPTDPDGRSLTAAQLDEDPRALHDRRGLVTLVGAVIDRVTGSSAALTELKSRLGLDSPAPADVALIERLTDLLFELAPPLPLSFDTSDAPDGESVGRPAAAGPVPSALRLSPPALPAVPAPVQRPARRSGRQSVRPRPPATAAQTTQADGFGGDGSGRDRTGTHESWAELSGSDGIGSDGVGLGGDPRRSNPLITLRDRLVRALAPVRTPVWIAGGAGLGALVVALVVIPAAHSGTATNPPESRPVARSSTEGSVRAAEASGSPVPSGSPVESGARPTPVVAPLTGNAADIAGADPLAAARTLLAERRACLTRRSVTCLSGVDQAGSAVLEADRELVRRVKAGSPLPAETMVDGFTPRLVQQLGDSAIIQLVAADGTTAAESNPAPLLVVRSGAGWRIRDLSVG